MGFNRRRHLGGNTGFNAGKFGNSIIGGDTLSSIFSSYNAISMWSAENLDISGTTTTALDYAGIYDLVNPAATNQPTFNAASANFNSKPSLSFTTDDVLTKFTGWRVADTSGVIVSVYRSTVGGTVLTHTLSLSSSVTTNIYTTTLVRSNLFNPTIKRGGTTNDIRTDISMGAAGTDPMVTAYRGDGVDYAVFGSSGEGVITSIQGGGADNGDWFTPDLVGADTLAIGGLNNGASGIGSWGYGEIEWCATLYLPYTTDATIVNCINELNAYYGI